MIDDCWHLATTAKGKHEWMILSHSPKMSQIYVANFCEDICTACRGVSMALAFQKHLMHNNHNGTHIVMHWKTWKQKTSLSAPKALSQGMFPVKNCITSYYPGTFRVRKTASFWCSNFAAAPRLWAKRLKNSARLGATSPGRGKSEPLIPLQHNFDKVKKMFLLQEYDRVSLI